MKAEAFADTFAPYRKRYTVRTESPLFDEPIWLTAQKPLKNRLIEQAILSLAQVGYFLTPRTTVLGLDIDDHRNLGEGYLLSILEQSVKALSSCDPSLLFRSPRGLHAYWLLSEPLPFDIVEACARSRLGKIPVEIRPTPDQSLRIPAEVRAVDPESMQLLNMPIEAILPAAHKYHPSSLFNTEFVPSAIVESLRSKRTKARVLRSLPNLEAIEQECLPFQNGATNDDFLKLCQVYRCAGLDVDQAIWRFNVCIAQSPGYVGGLTKPRELERRVRYEFAHNTYQPKPSPRQGELWDQVTCERIADLSPFAAQRRKPIIRFVDNLLGWVRWQDEIWANKRQVAVWDFLYPYYRKNRKAGYYPLPYTMLKRWNGQYNQLLPWLEEIGLLEPAPFKPSAAAHICRYYHVHQDRFGAGDVSERGEGSC